MSPSKKMIINITSTIPASEVSSLGVLGAEFLRRRKSIKGIVQSIVLRNMKKDFLFNRKALRHSGAFVNMDLKII